MKIQKTYKNLCKIKYSSSHRCMQIQKTYKNQCKINIFQIHKCFNLRKIRGVGCPGEGRER